VNLFGTAEEVVDKIEVLREQYGTDEIMFEVNWTSSVPREVTTNTIRILTDKVIPKFQITRSDWERVATKGRRSQNLY